MAEAGLEITVGSPEDVLDGGDQRLVDLIDGLLDHGVVLSGELWLSVADVDLVFLGLNAVLCTPDKVLKGGPR